MYLLTDVTTNICHICQMVLSGASKERIPLLYYRMVAKTFCGGEEFFEEVVLLAGAASLTYLVLECLKNHVELVQILGQPCFLVVRPLHLVTLEGVENFF